jgi:hypothetical protein
MSRLAMITDHRLRKDEAERRLKEKLHVVRERYGHYASDVSEAWDDGTLSFRFRAVGMNVKGTMEVNDGEVRISADVPFAVVLFRRRIEKRIRDELGDLLSRRAA